MEASLTQRFQLEHSESPLVPRCLHASQPVTPSIHRSAFGCLLSLTASLLKDSPQAPPPSSLSWARNSILPGLPASALVQAQIVFFIASRVIFLDTGQVASLNSFSLSWDKPIFSPRHCLFTSDPCCLVCSLHLLDAALTSWPHWGTCSTSAFFSLGSLHCSPSTWGLCPRCWLPLSGMSLPLGLHTKIILHSPPPARCHDS